jgi:hypothetical protein
MATATPQQCCPAQQADCLVAASLLLLLLELLGQLLLVPMQGAGLVHALRPLLLAVVGRSRDLAGQAQAQQQQQSTGLVVVLRGLWLD